MKQSDYPEFDYQQLSANEKKIAEYVTKNSDRILYMTLQEIAAALHVSTATVSRFWQHIGFDSFKAYKNHLKTSLNVNPAHKMQAIIQRIDDKDVIDEMSEIVSEHLHKTSQNLSRTAFEQAVAAICQAETVYIYAPGPTECLADLLCFRLSRFQYNIKKMPPSGHQIIETLLQIKPSDLVLIFGFANVLPEQQVLLDHSRATGYPSVLITDLFTSELIAMATHVLHVERGEIWEFHSMVTPILLIEAIIVSIALKNESQSLAHLEQLHRLRKQYKKQLPR